MYQVHWRRYENGEHVDKTHGTFNTLKEAQKSILDWWKQNNFKPPYVREISYLGEEDGCVKTWDYGSHSCFYDIYEINSDRTVLD